MLKSFPVASATVACVIKLPPDYTFRVLFPNQVIRADDLARAMVDIAVRGTVEQESLIFENRAIPAMVARLIRE
jgi:hypothetical protein